MPKTSTSYKKGQSGNPKGAPKRGESWAELYNSIGDLTGQQAAARALKLWAKRFKEMPEGVTLKEMAVIRAYASLLDEANARLLKEIADRAEGKVADVVKGAGDNGEHVIRFIDETIKKEDADQHD